MNPRKELWVNLALSGGTFLLLLVGVEQILRAVDYEYNPLKITVGSTEDLRDYHIFRDQHFVIDPDLIWRPKAGFDVFNAQGFRGPLLPRPKPAGSFVIFTVGDSNTLGWSEGGANWPEGLGALLQRRGGRGQVVNAGVYGYTSHQGLFRLRETLAYGPDLVLISFGSNDAQWVRVPDRDFAGRESMGRRVERVLRRFRVGQLAVAGWQTLASFWASEPVARVELAEYRENLRRMVAEGRERGVGTVLLTRPYVGEVWQEWRWKRQAHLYNLATVEVAESEDVSVIDLYSLFKGRDELFADESHFTDEGHHRAAQIVFQALEPLLP